MPHFKIKGSSINIPRGLHMNWLTKSINGIIWKKLLFKKITRRLGSYITEQARNEVNNAIKSAKKQYFMHNLEVNKMTPRKTWKLIDDLSWRKYGRLRNISEIKVNNEPISSAAEMAEVFNDFFCHYWIKFGKWNTAVNHWARILSTTHGHNIFS